MFVVPIILQFFVPHNRPLLQSSGMVACTMLPGVVCRRAVIACQVAPPRVSGSAYRAFDDGYQVSNVTNKAYQGAVYEPFNNTPPSEGGNAPRGISGRKNSWDWSGGGMGEGNGGEAGDDPGQRDEANEPVQPIGEPLVLLFFAAVAALVVARRQRQTA